jgi:hypothetical protein
LARTIVAKGLFFQAAYREAADAAEAVSNPRGPDAMAILGLALLRAGDKARADTILNELVRLEPFPVVPLAQWYAATGDTNEAFRILARTARLVRSRSSVSIPCSTASATTRASGAWLPQTHAERDFSAARGRRQPIQSPLNRLEGW